MGSELRLVVAKYGDQHFPAIQKSCQQGEDRFKFYSRSPSVQIITKDMHRTWCHSSVDLCFLGSENGILFSIISEDTVLWLCKC